MAAEANGIAKAYTFQWKIENAFNWWWLKKGEGIESPVFIADGIENTKWTLLFYPVVEKYEDYVGFYLQREKDCDGPDFVDIFFQFALLAEDGSILKEKTSPKTTFTKRFYWGFSRFEERGTLFFLEREDFLPEDSLKVQCSIWTTDQKPVDSSSLFAASFIKVKRRCFKWKINRPKNLESDVRNKFRDYLVTCNLLLHKNLDKLRVSLSCVDGSIRYISCNISIRDTEGRKENCGIQKYFADDLKLGPLIFKLELLSKHLMQNQDRYYPNDILSLDFEFVLLAVENSLGLENVIVGNEKFENTTDLVDDICSLFSDDIFKDVEIRTPTKNFFAHRNILSARSPVFLRMLSQNMQERNSGVIEIPDYDEHTVNRMLMYIYSGSLQDLEFESAVNLYKIADKYEILSLRNYCSFFIKKNLSPVNACDTLVLADFYSDGDLKSYVQDYILKQRKQIFYSREWEDFMKDHLKLAADIMFMKLTKNRSLLSDA